MSSFWNERYSSESYAYGTEPNLFFKSKLQHLKQGKILLPGEGEGRNAVYAAKSGWKVHAVDNSDVAAKKAIKLADAANVTVHYKVADIKEIQYPENEFDYIAIIFLHLAPTERISFHKKMLSFLKPGGILLMEAFSKKQLEKKSGGPKNINLLYSKEELHADFSSTTNTDILETDSKLNEGTYHQGEASLIRMIAVK